MKNRTTPVAAVIVATAGLTVAANAGVRIIHASPDTPNVDVYVNQTPLVDTPAVPNLAFTQGTDYIALPTGDYDVQVAAAGTDTVPLQVNPFSVDDTQDVTVVAGNFFSSIEPFVFTDDRTSDANNARVRFIHMAPDVDTVDVAVAGDALPLFNAVSFGQSGGYLTLPAGTIDHDVRFDADDSVALPVPGVTLRAGLVYTIFAMGSLQTNDVQPVVFVDATPAPGAVATLGLAGLMATRRRR